MLQKHLYTKPASWRSCTIQHYIHLTGAPNMSLHTICVPLKWELSKGGCLWKDNICFLSTSICEPMYTSWIKHYCKSLAAAGDVWRNIGHVKQPSQGWEWKEEKNQLHFAETSLHRIGLRNCLYFVCWDVTDDDPNCIGHLGVSLLFLFDTHQQPILLIMDGTDTGGLCSKPINIQTRFVCVFFYSRYGVTNLWKILKVGAYFGIHDLEKRCLNLYPEAYLL